MLDLATIAPYLLTAFGSLASAALHQYFGGTIPILSPLLNLIGITATPSTPATPPASTAPTIGSAIDSLLAAASGSNTTATSLIQVLTNPQVAGLLSQVVGAVKTFLDAAHASSQAPAKTS